MASRYGNKNILKSFNFIHLHISTIFLINYNRNFHVYIINACLFMRTVYDKKTRGSKLPNLKNQEQ